MTIKLRALKAEGRYLYTGHNGRKRSVYWPQWTEEICIVATIEGRDLYTGHNGRKRFVYWPQWKEEICIIAPMDGRDLYNSQQWKDEIYILATIEGRYLYTATMEGRYLYTGHNGRKSSVYWPQWTEEICIVATMEGRDLYTGHNGRKSSVFWQQWKEAQICYRVARVKSGARRILVLKMHVLLECIALCVNGNWAVWVRVKCCAKCMLHSC